MQRSGSQFGLLDGEWHDALRELRDAILEAAYDRRMTSYCEVAAKITVVRIEAHSALLNHLLGSILAEEHAAKRPLLTAIVTHKNGDLEPGAGFYDMARSLGYHFEDPLIFWSTQVTEVFKMYGRPRRVSTRLKG